MGIFSFGIERRIAPLKEDIQVLLEEVDALRSRLDLGPEAFESFQAVRTTPGYLSVFDIEKPLVSICIATFNRADLLLRSIRSLQNQTYDRIEILVVGDACTDHTASLIQSLKDPRIRFENRPERGIYPDDPKLRWMVAGTEPINDALRMSTGHFITHLDDDDEHAPERIQKLLDRLREDRADIVWHPFDYETSRGKWKRNEALQFRKNQLTTSSVMYHSWFKRIPWDGRAYQYREPGDWNRFRKIKYLAAKAVRHPESMLRHYRERNNG